MKFYYEVGAYKTSKIMINDILILSLLFEERKNFWCHNKVEIIFSWGVANWKWCSILRGWWVANYINNGDGMLRI
jgi:hypothetical protein